MSGAWRSLAELLAHRSQRAPERLAFRFLEGLGARESALDYEELDRLSRAVAALLLSRGLERRPVLLLLPPGLPFVTAIFGCAYARAVAVPAYPPHPARVESALDRLQSLAADAEVAGVLTTSALRDGARSLLGSVPSLASVPWLSVESDVPSEDAVVAPSAAREDLALLQYTSGSTRAPRGVMLTHDNLLDNAAFIEAAFGHSSESRGVIWLPPYHDMGLMGGIVQPVFAGFSCTLMPPLDFFRRPVLWLRAITRFRATTSGGPNFAYERCLRRIPSAQREGLDLRSWEVAFNGAEPVSADTLRRFAEAFAPCGFRARSWLPCYGLAEATLAVTCAERDAPATIASFRARGLEENRAETSTSEDGESLRLVGCGRPASPEELAIRDPSTGEALPEARVGEICIRNRSVARGYWRREEETSEVFRTRIAGRRQSYLRTGDLGFLHREELFVTGRLKELLSIRGRKYYPQDVEAFARAAHGALGKGAGAAFTVEGELSERLVLVHEVEDRPPWEAESLLGAVRRAIAASLELQLSAIVLVRPGTIPRTTSGKIQRALCRSLFLERRLRAVASFRLDEAPDADPSPFPLAPSEDVQ